MREISITSVDEGQRLDKYLAKFMPEAPKSFFLQDDAKEEYCVKREEGGRYGETCGR